MFYDIFKQLCDFKGISPSRACLDMNLSRSLGAKWKNTGANPSFDVLSKIATYFGVSTDYLLGNEQKEKPTGSVGLTEKEKKLLASFRNMTDDAQDSFLNIAAAASAKISKEEKK